MTGRAPDFHLKALNRRTERRTGKIGAAWLNTDGSITLQLDMCISIPDDPDILLTLFPNDGAKKTPVKSSRVAVPKPVPTAAPASPWDPLGTPE